MSDSSNLPLKPSMTMGELYLAIGGAYSIAHLRRWAHAGKIPGTHKRAKRHFRFRRCPRLHKWIQETTLRFDREQMEREIRRNFGRKHSANTIAHSSLKYLAAMADRFSKEDLPNLRIKNTTKFRNQCESLFALVDSLLQRIPPD